VAFASPIRWEVASGSWSPKLAPDFPALEDGLVLSVSTNHAATMLARNFAEVSLRESESATIGDRRDAGRDRVVRCDGSIRSCNPAAQRILGVTETR